MKHNDFRAENERYLAYSPVPPTVVIWDKMKQTEVKEFASPERALRALNRLTTIPNGVEFMAGVRKAFDEHYANGLYKVLDCWTTVESDSRLFDIVFAGNRIEFMYSHTGNCVFVLTQDGGEFGTVTLLTAPHENGMPTYPLFEWTGISITDFDKMVMEEG